MTPAQQSRRKALAKMVRVSRNSALKYHNDVVDDGDLAVADFIIAEQERREGPLTLALQRIYDDGGRGAEDALAALVAYDRLDAPPQRTVEEIAADVVALRPGREFSDMPDMLATFKKLDALTDELAAALKRGKE